MAHSSNAFVGGMSGYRAPPDTRRAWRKHSRNRASGLNLVVAAITLWNTVYLDRAVKALREDRTVEDQLLQHLSPLPWDHIHLTGDYHWHANKRVAKGGFRPLRQRKTPSTES